MDWEAFMDGIVADIGQLGPEIPETVRGFNIMGSAAKKSLSLIHI